MKKNYVLQPLESLLHAIANDPQLERTEDQTAHLIQTISEEKGKVYGYLKTKIFNLTHEDRTRLMVQKYHHALILLINQAFNLQKDIQKPHISSTEILEYLLITLEEIQQFLELSYPAFLDPEKRVGLPEMVLLKKEIEEKLPLLPDILIAGKNNENAINIVLLAFHAFIDRVDNQEAITIKEYDYHKLFLNDLITRGSEPMILQDCPTLHELLFFWNFNSEDSLKYFRTGLEELAKAKETHTDKLEFMRLQFKRLLHIPVMNKQIYDKNFPSMKSYFTGWLKNEIDYLEQKKDGVDTLVDGFSGSRSGEKPIKVMVDLSADQIGLILRAADESRIIVSRSLSLVYKSIVPHLSTPRKDDPSWENMRSRSYNPERREVVLAVDALEKLIGIIKHY
ncbi:hypothetical protein [Chitinophaga defluvii]|uniref:Uncharacterized protein n=1 Tax=Chitinophaga defluvii TaxID=3163343 RepID=A0ABV2TCF9_9BACT